MSFLPCRHESGTDLVVLLLKANWPELIEPSLEPLLKTICQAFSGSDDHHLFSFAEGTVKVIWYSLAQKSCFFKEGMPFVVELGRGGKGAERDMRPMQDLELKLRTLLIRG